MAIKDKKLFLEIFPEAKAFVANGEISLPFALAKLVSPENNPGTRLFAVKTLFKLINDEKQAPLIKRLYGYGHKEFAADSLAYDPLNVHLITPMMNATLCCLHQDGSYEQHFQMIYIQQNGCFAVKFNIDNLQQSTIGLRFVPDMLKLLSLKIDKVEVNGQNASFDPINAVSSADGWDCFCARIPQYAIEYQGSAGDYLAVEIRGEKNQNEEDVWNKLDIENLAEKNARLERRVKELENTLSGIGEFIAETLAAAKD